MTHALKIRPEYFEAVQTGRKPFELRWNDRGFRKDGDSLHHIHAESVQHHGL